jgi:hypothetical protein
MNQTKETWPIGRLSNWDKNPRSIRKADFERLKRQIKKHGQFKPVIVTPDGEVIGGNMRLRAYRDLGIADVWVSVVDPKDEAEKVGIALADNDRAGYYEEQAVAELLCSIPDLDLEDYHFDLGKTVSAKDLLGQFAPVEEDDFDVEGALPEEGEAVSQLGDIYQLGKHRLMCGSATSEKDTRTLFNGNTPTAVVADPPYGIDLVKGGSVGNADGYRDIIGDDSIQTALDFISLINKLGIRQQLLWGGNYYAHALAPSSCWIVWDKQAGKHVTFADCELAWTNFQKPVRMYTHVWDGFRRDSEQGEKRVHPTQKPVKLLGDIIKDFLASATSIYDGFGGSGSTLVACEQLGIPCRMMELDPRYCDVIVKRWEAFTGRKADKTEKD